MTVIPNGTGTWRGASESSSRDCIGCRAALPRPGTESGHDVLATEIRHCMVDGMSGMNLAALLMSPSDSGPRADQRAPGFASGTSTR